MGHAENERSRSTRAPRQATGSGRNFGSVELEHDVDTVSIVSLHEGNDTHVTFQPSLSAS